MRVFCFVMAILFGILAVVLYNASIREVDIGFYGGKTQIANIQSTVFAAAAAIACILNLLTAFIIGTILDARDYLYQSLAEDDAEDSDDSAEEEGSIKPAMDKNAELTEEQLENLPEREPYAEENSDSLGPVEKVIINEGDKCCICGIKMNPNDMKEWRNDRVVMQMCEDCSKQMKLINDEWLSGRKKQRAAEELRELLDAGKVSTAARPFVEQFVQGK